MGSDKIREILGKGGVIARMLEDYEYRPQQIEMAEAVLDAIVNEEHLVVEAATGIGKTMGYLIPALVSGERVVVSTNTKTLQDQIFNKDIPRLKEYWPDEFKAVRLKGRNNYLCLYKYDDFRSNPLFYSEEEKDLWPQIPEWVETTQYGEQSELVNLPPNSKLWSELSIGSEGCPGSKCQYFEDCFAFKARKEAKDAHIIIVNHHLFYSDLSQKSENSKGFLPEYKTVIFDEAHHIEKVATEHFSRDFSVSSVSIFTENLERSMRTIKVHSKLVSQACTALEKRSNQFFDMLSAALEDGSVELHEFLEKIENKRNKRFYEKNLDALYDAIDALRKTLRQTTELGEVGSEYLGHLTELNDDLDYIIEASDKKSVFFIEKRGRWVAMRAAPINISEELSKRLIYNQKSIVFTSATLSVGHSLSYFRHRVGLYDGDHVKELILPEVFNYKDNCMLYVPSNMPEPTDKRHDFAENCAQIIFYLLNTTDGKAFVLFTSYRNMEKVYELVVDMKEKKDEQDIEKGLDPSSYTFIKQGDAPQDALVDQFKKDVNSVLFATASFWEGVDVKGEALRLVIIDKLPFASPGDPIVKARCDDLANRGLRWFDHYSIPEAALTLKQGFGRLIRSHDDYGIVAILDSRLINKYYGDRLLSSLPPATRCFHSRAARDWWRERSSRDS